MRSSTIKSALFTRWSAVESKRSHSSQQRTHHPTACTMKVQSTRKHNSCLRETPKHAHANVSKYTRKQPDHTTNQIGSVCVTNRNALISNDSQGIQNCSWLTEYWGCITIRTPSNKNENFPAARKPRREPPHALHVLSAKPPNPARQLEGELRQQKLKTHLCRQQ